MLSSTDRGPHHKVVPPPFDLGVEGVKETQPGEVPYVASGEEMQHASTGLVPPLEKVPQVAELVVTRLLEAVFRHTEFQRGTVPTTGVLHQLGKLVGQSSVVVTNDQTAPLERRCGHDSTHKIRHHAFTVTRIILAATVKK